MKGRAPDAGQDAVQEFQINRSNYGADMGGASGPPSTLCRSRAPTTCMAAPLASSVTVCWMRAIRSPSVRRWRQTRPFRISTPIRWHSDQEFARPAAVWRRHRLSGHEKQDLPIYFFRRAAAEFAEFRSRADGQLDLRRTLDRGKYPAWQSPASDPRPAQQQVIQQLYASGRMSRCLA